MLKPGVKLAGIRPELVLAIYEARELWMLMTMSEFVITSVTDGTHSANSLHYSGRAFDMRTKPAPGDLVVRYRDRLRATLGSEFDVVLEGQGTPNEHIHVEWDPKP